MVRAVCHVQFSEHAKCSGKYILQNVSAHKIPHVNDNFDFK